MTLVAQDRRLQPAAVFPTPGAGEGPRPRRRRPPVCRREAAGSKPGA